MMTPYLTVSPSTVQLTVLYPEAKSAIASASKICDGSVPGSNEVKSLLFTRGGAAACNNADNAGNPNDVDNTENIDATNRDKQIFQVSKLVTGPDDKSIIVDSHTIMMTVKANENGVGSYMCMIDSTGTGTDTGAGIWTEMEVTSNSTDKIAPDGVADVEIQAAIDPNQKCTGRLDDKENVCMVSCRDAATPGSLEKSVYVQKAGEQNTPTPTDPNSDIQARDTVAMSSKRSHQKPSRPKKSSAAQARPQSSNAAQARPQSSNAAQARPQSSNAAAVILAQPSQRVRA
ncbi:CAS1 appressorium specific protein [Blumeria hordei DH14]|uniref:CAS1 appressorium specific protein n=1 Tax=Blumeria graminis f. sp. hordei (strain DH14) TaxID=546991 RepID=N1J5U5_BLUG1|nr:CAS1 appressorium specific protein [Blumeria hordei DH14]